MSDIKVVRRPSPEPDDSATQLRDAEAEKLALGDILLRPEQVQKYIEAGLCPDLFAHPINQRVMTAIATVTAAGLDPDLPAVRHQLTVDGRLDEVGPAYLCRLSDGCPRQGLNNIRATVQRLDQLARTRRFVYAIPAFTHRLTENPAGIDNGLLDEHIRCMEQLRSIEPTADLFVTPQEIASKATKAVPFVVGGYAAEHSITQLSGKAKAAGKTSFLLALGRSVLIGSDFIGQATTSGPVVYLTEERLPSFHAALQRAGLIERHDLHIVSFWDLADRSWPGICLLAKAQCAQVNAKLLVIDTLSQFAGFKGEQENNSGDANTALAPLQQIAHHLPLAVIVVRHDRKSGGAVGEAARGSGQFTAGVDIVLHLGPRESRGEPTQRELTAMSRYEETPPPW